MNFVGGYDKVGIFIDIRVKGLETPNTNVLHSLTDDWLHSIKVCYGNEDVWDFAKVFSSSCYSTEKYLNGTSNCGNYH